MSLEGFSNEEAVDVLRRTGQVTRLKLARHRYGSKYDQLLHAAAVGQLLRILSVLLSLLGTGRVCYLSAVCCCLCD